MKWKMLKAVAAVLMVAVTLISNPFGMLTADKAIAAEKKAKPKKMKKEKKVKLSKTSLALRTGKKAKLKVTNLSKKAKLKWISSNKSIASVDKGGIKAKKSGKVKITAVITEKGKKTLKLICKITVINSKGEEMKAESSMGGHAVKIDPNDIYVPEEDDIKETPVKKDTDEEEFEKVHERRRERYKNAKFDPKKPLALDIEDGWDDDDLIQYYPEEEQQKILQYYLDHGYKIENGKLVEDDE